MNESSFHLTNIHTHFDLDFHFSSILVYVNVKYLDNKIQADILATLWTVEIDFHEKH